MTAIDGIEREIERLISGPDFVENPYPAYRYLQENAPVWRTPSDMWVFSRYADCTKVFRDWKTFGRGGGYGSEEGVNSDVDQDLDAVLESGTLMSHTLVGTDPPQHTRLRQLLQRVFSPTEVERLRVRVEAMANELIDRVESQGEMDIMADYARPLPAMMITEMLGVDYGDAETWEPWANTIHAGTAAVGFLPDQIESARVAMAAASDARREEAYYFKALIEERRRVPGNDLITMLAEIEEQGDRLSEIEMLATLVLTLGGGHHTSVSLIGNEVNALLSNPEQMTLLRDDPSLVSGVIEETLRMDPTLQSSSRVANVEVEVAGVTLMPGDRVKLMIAAANRDPEVFPDPDRYDIQRENADKHISFGLGIHHCMGHALARAEAIVAMEVLFERLPNLRIVEHNPPHDGWWNLRGLDRLRVAWDAP